MAEEGEDVLEACLQKALNFLAERGFSLELRQQQKASVKQLFIGGDLLAVLPTGFGKSLIFQLLALTREASVILVICPLKSIVKDQIKEASSMGISAGSLSECLQTDIESGKYRLLFASAEEALAKCFLDSLKREGNSIHDNLAAIVVDESHTIETWTGKRSKGKTFSAFRESFGKLASLRSFCKKGTPVAALTGTADERTRKTIQESLALNENLLTVYVSPNRENLRFCVKKVKKEQQLEELQWLINLIKVHGKDTPKTLIFCNTLNEIAHVTNYLLSKLGAQAYDKQTKVPENCFLGVYHSNSWDRNKERIASSLKAKNGSIKRVVVATTALCMGVNFPDIRFIITWGAARSLLDFHQEAGRAGRDGILSHIVILYHGQQIGPCENEIKQFIRTNGCLRVGAYQSLDKNIKSLSPLHNCCSFCGTICKCNGDSCSAEPLPFETEANLPEEAVSKRTREVTTCDRQDLHHALKEVVKNMEMQGLSIDNTSSHGFSEQLISDVVSKCTDIFTIEDVLGNFPVFSVGDALQILEIMQEIFLDIPNLEEMVALFSFSSGFSHRSWFNLEDYAFSDSGSEDELYLSWEEPSIPLP